MKTRLDIALAQSGLVASRSQAESYIKLGKVKVNGKILNKSSILVSSQDKLEVEGDVQYVGRAALKLAGAAKKFKLNLRQKYWRRLRRNRHAVRLRLPGNEDGTI